MILTRTSSVLLACIGPFVIVSCKNPAPPSRASNRNSTFNGSANCLKIASSSSTWNDNISAIFTSNCASCHPGVQKSDYTSYQSVVSNSEQIKRNIESGSMPKGKTMPPADKSLVLDWLAAGAPESSLQNPDNQDSSESGSDAPASTPPDCTSAKSDPVPATAESSEPTSSATPGDLGSPTYALGIQPIMAERCVSCHSSAGKQAPNLDTLDSVKTNYAKIIAALESGKMPAVGTVATRIQENQPLLKLLKQWGTAPNAPYGQYAP